ncbi:MAG: hypothetical protein ACI4L9_01480 [Candidatus Coproplasma sp.]
MNKFSAYSSLMNYGTPATGSEREGLLVLKILLPMIVPLVGVICFAIESWGTAFCGMFVFCLSLFASIFGALACNKPSLISLVPVNYKRRTAFYFLSLLQFSLIFPICFVPLWAVCYSIPILIIGGAERWTYMFLEFFSSEFLPINLIFVVLTAFWYCGWSTLVCYGTCKKSFWLSWLAYLLITVVGTVFIIGPFSAEGADGDLIIRIPWHALIPCAVLSLSVFALSVVYVLRREKPKEF